MRKIIFTTTFVCLILSFSLFFGCSQAEPLPEVANVPVVQSFNRKMMLEFWAHNFIIPAYENYQSTLVELVSAKNSFLENNNVAQLDLLKEKWAKAYKAWQWVSMFEIGRAEQIGYRNFVNIYPADIEKINAHISDGVYNLELPSTFDTQGFPALDYLLFEVLSSDSDFASLSNEIDYSGVLIERLFSLNIEILNSWNDGFATSFIENDGSSATASTDKLVNDYIFYFEKFLRAGKVGIPAGVFTGTEQPNLVEALYSEMGNELLKEALTATQRFFDGQSFNNQTTGTSLKQYIEFEAQNNPTELANNIDAQFMTITAEVDVLNRNLRQQVEENNTLMLQTYDALQRNVILFKVDMLQILNIQVDYIDADGD